MKTDWAPRGGGIYFCWRAAPAADPSNERTNERSIYVMSAEPPLPPPHRSKLGSAPSARDSTLRSLPFGPKDLLVRTEPADCGAKDSGNEQADALRHARCQNWELGQWYRENLVKSDAADLALDDMATYTRDERTQLAVTSVGLGAVLAGTMVALIVAQRRA